MMPSLLRRQLKKFLPENLQNHPELGPFLDAVASSYGNYDEKLSMMQRATAISSEELAEAYEKLNKEAERQKQVEIALKKTVDTLNINLGVIDKLEHNNSLNLSAEKLASHISKLASQIAKVTEEKNTLLLDLESQNDSLNNYVQMVSHDLKSPIRNINALMSWILEEEKIKFSVDSKQNFSMVSENLTRMDNLINGILKHATVGDHMEMKTNIDMQALLENVKASLEIPSNVIIELSPNLPVILIQKYWVEQLFDNLLANAVKATENKKDALISIKYIEDEIFWKFSVSDNGKGIEEKHLSTIFEMFTKLENGSNAAGVGLSLVKKITALFQGTVWLESEVNKGTTFYVTFKKDYHG